jgi:hypothetical protein
VIAIIVDRATEKEVQRAALRLAHAIVADAQGGANGASGTNKPYGEPLRLFGRRY